MAVETVPRGPRLDVECRQFVAGPEGPRTGAGDSQEGDSPVFSLLRGEEAIDTVLLFLSLS